jgi:hypothetical protein
MGGEEVLFDIKKAAFSEAAQLHFMKTNTLKCSKKCASKCVIVMPTMQQIL